VSGPAWCVIVKTSREGPGQAWADVRDVFGCRVLGAVLAACRWAKGASDDAAGRCDHFGGMPRTW